MKIKNLLLKHKWIALMVVLVPVIILVGQKILGSNKTETQQQVTSTVKKGTITSYVSTTGTIQAANYLAITTSVNGIVKKVYVTEGTEVVRGQKIMEITLDSEGEKSLADAYSSYLRAKNSLESAKNSLYGLETSMLQKEEAFEDEKDENSYQSHDERLSYKYAENDYTQAKNSYEIQKSSITQAEIALESAYSEYQAYSSTILAPASGIIANIVATEGTKIENSVTSDRSVETVASIKQEGTPTASLNVTEVDINSIKVGQKAKLTLSSVSDQIFDGTVTGIDKIGTQSSGVSNYPVIIKFDSDSDLVLPNMSVTADIIVDSHDNALYVPSGAVNTSGDTKYVLVPDGTSQKKVTVKVGISDDSNTEILEGLNEGDVVILSTLPTEGFTSTSSNSSDDRGGGMIMGGPGM
ncbi:MAG: efflux RND transporter periplasmic adaptor subunit [Patescibacteria group bacterium]